MKTLTKTAAANQSETAPAIRNKGQKGSTIVAVMAALVFIGIVVASMLKNTGSQAAASRGYGSVMDMSSTAASGIVATEGFFGTKDTERATRAKNVIDTIVQDIRLGTYTERYIYGSKTQRSPLSASSGQYFSSVPTRYRQDNLTTSGGNVRAGFLVAAGKSSRGKDMQKALAYYQFDNLMKLPTGNPPVTNAFFSAGGANNADAGMIVTGGGATFLGKVSFQNVDDVYFEKEAYFGDEVTFPGNVTAQFKEKAYFMNKAVFQAGAVFDSMVYFKETSNFKWATFNSVAYFTKKATFTDSATFNDFARFDMNAEFSKKATFNYDVYFGGEAYFMSEPVTFNGRVGFDGTINTNMTIKSPNNKDVYMNANFTSSSNGKLQGAGLDSQKVTFSSKPTDTDKAKFINITHHNGSSGMTASAKLAGISATNANKMNYQPSVNDTSRVAREDPELDSIMRIYNASTSNGGSVVIYNAANVMTSNGTGFDIVKLKQSYETASANPSTLYMGKFMVIEVTSSISPPANDPGIFDANIIYIIKAGGTLDMGTKFYSSSENSTASTLVYVGAGNAKLNQFGTSGNFRGFIYIDKNNTADNSLKFPGSGKIIGAVHNFSSRPIGWNTGVAGYSIPIEFNTDVINDFATLYKPKDDGSSNGEVVFQPIRNYIEVKPLGFYFGLK